MPLVTNKDGLGNGNCILTIPQSKLLHAVASWNSDTLDNDKGQ